MKYAGYMPNDFINGEGVCVSLWTVGCPHKCKGCHNAEAWDSESGIDVPSDIKGQLVKAIGDNGVTRNFSVLGGEPLYNGNIEFVKSVLLAVRTAYPNIKIFLWTGYTLEELQEQNNDSINKILSLIDVLIDGRFILEKRDISLHLKGSTNQRVLYRGIDFDERKDK